MADSKEVTEHVVMDQAVQQWCQSWKVDPATLKQEVVVDDDHPDKLVIEVSAQLLKPITSVRTRLVLNSSVEE